MFLRRFTRSRHIHDDVADRFRAHLSRGRILDLPAGDGVNSRSLAAAGYEVVASDLYPENVQGEGFEIVKADLTERLPFPSESFDGILFSEGIEHLDAQIASLTEMERVLRPGGVMIVTTPNTLSLGCRLNQLLIGHAHGHRAGVFRASQTFGARPQRREAVPVEGSDVVKVAGVYLGHVFLINAFQLRYYLEHAGFEVVGVDTTRYSIHSLLLAIFLFLPVWWATRRFLARSKSRLSPEQQRSYREQILSWPVLLGRKLIMVARKPPRGSERTTATGSDREAVQKSPNAL